MIRLGMHSFTEQIPFTHGTPSVEASWAFNAYPGLGLRESVERVLAQKRRGVRPILRIDYAPGQVCPPNEVGCRDFLTEVVGVLSEYPEMRDIDISPFNEPNLNAEGAFPAEYVAKCTQEFIDQFPDHRVWVCATLAHGSEVMERTPPTHIEQSPWSAYFFRLLFHLNERRVAPHGFLLHGYARPGQLVSPEGWRFSYNIIETWNECLRHFPRYRNKPVVISEWNCRTGGQTTADQYKSGQLARDLMYTGQVFGHRADSFCVFVGRHDNVWTDDCLLAPRRRCVGMRAEYDYLKAAGF
ncbi:MAG: hypothetical protein OXG11_11895 [Chloroflexi bacterium]|nr:hypothetical protein [Chloroflexota bacterium]